MSMNASGPERGRRRRKTGIILLLLVLWEAAARLSGVSPLLFPPVSEVVRTLISDLGRGVLPGRIGYSLLIVGEGVGIGLAAALLLSLAGRHIGMTVDTLVALMHPLPGIALLPIVILWAGVGHTAVLLIIVHSVLWPLTTSITAGIRTIPQHLYDVSRNFRLNPARTAVHLIVPGIFPHMMAGLRIGWARAWRALIAAEMVFGAAGGGGGIGWYIFQKRVFMDTRGLFAGLLVIMLIGILFESYLFDAIERATIRKWGVSR
jgi:NitT/TauT family transport system permease protein